MTLIRPASIIVPPAHHADDDGGLQQDLALMAQRGLLQRRRLMGFVLTGGAAAFLAGCGGGEESTSTSGTTTGSTTGSTSGTTTTTDDHDHHGRRYVRHLHRAGFGDRRPYPSDGSNAVNGTTSNVLAQSGVVRSDIRTSFGSYTGTAAGIPLTINLKLMNARNACAALAGYVVYLWHCDRDGNYSLYSSTVLTQNYLRGVQASDSTGLLSFQTIFPGCYSGRYPHIHFEVYPTLASATSYVNKILTSQIALPADACSAVYATSGYSRSATNFSMISVATDGIFADNTAAELAVVTPTLTGDVTAGYAGTLNIGILA